MHLGAIDPSASDLARPDVEAACALCGTRLIAKCGEIVRWHWAHDVAAESCPWTTQGLPGYWAPAWRTWAERQGSQINVGHGRLTVDILSEQGERFKLVTTQTGTPTLETIARYREELGGMVWIYRIEQAQFDRLWNIGDGWFKWGRGLACMKFHAAPDRVLWHHTDRLFEIAGTRFEGRDTFLKFKGGTFPDGTRALGTSSPAPFHVDEAAVALTEFTS